MNKKAFTLIELMIVVVILGVLMATVLPKLTWWQAKARDIARTADLTAISQALEMYTADNQQFPLWDDACLVPGDTTWALVIADIDRYLKNAQVPSDPVPTAKIWDWTPLCQSWAYYYQALSNNWFARAWYIICADMENYSNANFDASSLSTLTDVAGAGWAVTWFTAEAGTVAAPKPNDSIYCVIR